MNSDASKFIGPILIVLGLFMLLSQLGLPAFGMLWPLLLLVIGGAMIWRYRQSREDSGMIFTGVLLALLALFFQAVQWDWLELGRHWPFFVLAPGVGFLVMSRVDADRSDAAVPGWILVGLALIFYFFSLGFFVALLEVLFRILGIVLKVVIPLGLIALGGWLLFRRGRGLGDARSPFPEKIDPNRPVTEPGPTDPGEPPVVTTPGGGAGDAAAADPRVTEEAERGQAPEPPTGEPERPQSPPQADAGIEDAEYDEEDERHP